MVKRRGWSYTEEKVLIDNYHIKTIQELKELLPKRADDSINSKIKRLKAIGKLIEGKSEEAINRAYKQRNDNTEK